MVERARPQYEIRIERERGHPMGMVLQYVEAFSQINQNEHIAKRGNDFRARRLTPLASHTRTVRSLEAVYKMPLPLSPPPPHRTTFTLAVCPPSVYSHRRTSVDHTRTVPSFDDEARRGAEAFLRRLSKQEFGERPTSGLTGG